MHVLAETPSYIHNATNTNYKMSDPGYCHCESNGTCFFRITRSNIGSPSWGSISSSRAKSYLGSIALCLGTLECWRHSSLGNNAGSQLFPLSEVLCSEVFLKTEVEIEVLHMRWTLQAVPDKLPGQRKVSIAPKWKGKDLQISIFTVFLYPRTGYVCLVGPAKALVALRLYSHAPMW